MAIRDLRCFARAGFVLLGTNPNNDATVRTESVEAKGRQVRIPLELIKLI